MKDIVKSLTQEQKESIVEFVAKWLKDGKTVDISGDYSNLTITSGDIRYFVSMGIFDKNELFSIIVMNTSLNVKLSVQVKDINNQSLVKDIENFLISQQIQNGIGSELTDMDFYNVTNIEVDPSKLRARKITKLRENM